MMELGEKLKGIRLKKQMTLEELSQRSKVSKSLLSQIERNISVPTVTKLQKISQALDMNMSSFFTEMEGFESSSSIDDKKENSKRVDVVRKGERKKMIMPWGGRYEMLCPDLQHKMEFIYLRYPVGTKTHNQYSHEGEECGVVLEGKFKGTIGDQEIILEPGDSIYYPSTIPHSWEAVGDTEARAIWAISPPSF